MAVDGAQREPAEPALTPRPDPGGQPPFRPCFVVGCERSGTTLLAVLLGRHSQIAMTPETHFLKVVPRRGARQALTHGALLERMFAEKRIADLHVDRARLARRFAAYPATYAGLFRALLEDYAAAEGKARPGEKTPLHLLHVPRILQWYPEARIICLVRDGRDVVLSMLQMPWITDHRLRPLCWKWVQLLRRAAGYCRRYPRQFMLVRHEDLLRQPETVLRQIDAFAGLSFEPAQLDATVASRVVPAWETQWKADALEKPDPSRIGAWKKKVTPRQHRVMNTLMGGDLRRMGYGDTAGPPAPLAARLANGVANAIFWSGLFRAWQVVERHLPAARRQRRQARAAAGTGTSTAASNRSAAST